MTTTPTSGAAIQRYKIGYHADEWGQRSSTPSGIPDTSGSWVRYADHVAALAAGQATAAPTHEQIAAYLESTGAYVTNDATREAAIAEAIDTDRAKRGQAPDLHPKTSDLVQRFAAALAEKLSAAEKKYGYSDGWASPNWMDECRQHLSAHIAKGDPRDVAAYCAFLWHHGATTASPQAEQQAPASDGFMEAVNELDALYEVQPAPAGETSKPHGWLYDWTHSSATGKPDTTYTGFTKDEAHARKHDNCTAVFTTPQPSPTAQAADSVTEPAGVEEGDIDAVALARYKVVPAHESMFHRFAVVAGDGKRQLYLGREIECANMARKFAGAFLDGAFYQSNIAPTPPAQAADSVQEDAARYRWLAASCRSTSEHWGGRWSIVVEGPAPKSHDSEDDFDAAVDAARKQGASQ